MLQGRAKLWIKSQSEWPNPLASAPHVAPTVGGVAVDFDFKAQLGQQCPECGIGSQFLIHKLSLSLLSLALKLSNCLEVCLQISDDDLQVFRQQFQGERAATLRAYRFYRAHICGE